MLMTARCSLILSCCSLFLAASAFGAPPTERPEVGPVIPERFTARIGGMLGATYRVELTGETLRYSIERKREKSKPVEIKPTPAQWKVFRADLDAANIWQWEPSHVNRRVLDGTHWGLEIAYSDRSLKAQGSNSYPDDDGRPNGKPAMTAPFRRYLEAVEKLLGGKRFR